MEGRRRARYGGSTPACAGPTEVGFWFGPDVEGRSRARCGGSAPACAGPTLVGFVPADTGFCPTTHPLPAVASWGESRCSNFVPASLEPWVVTPVVSCEAAARRLFIVTLLISVNRSSAGRLNTQGYEPREQFNVEDREAAALAFAFKSGIWANPIFKRDYGELFN